MTDRELLEAAARAAGINIGPQDGAHARALSGPGLWFYTDARSHPMCRQPNRPGNVLWNPLDDDGDALRLAVKLHLHKAISIAHRLVSAETDFYTATRRAIVIAAAALAAPADNQNGRTD